MSARRLVIRILIPILLLAVVPGLAAQDAARTSGGAGDAAGKDAAVREHVQAIESSFRQALDDVVERFEAHHFSAFYLDETTPAERRAVIDSVQMAAADPGDVMMGIENDRYVLTLIGSERYDVTFTVDDAPPFGITSLAVTVARPGADPIHFSRENLDDTFSRLEDEGMAGVIFVRRGDEILIERAFGMANDEIGTSNRLETIFGIGSRPIDFTRAAIYLLDQRGVLSLDDEIGRHFESVPSDKQGMTVRHLMTGRSGLPDFFHMEDDWDPDLAWIDRDTAVDRLLAQELLFTPGSDRRHSHGAFVLLAALVERASGLPYEEFLRAHFLEPARMDRTGEYGQHRNLSLADFAVGEGRQTVGIPNIPPNWGPTSWLIKGSGGMYSTLDDLRNFYAYVRSGEVLDGEHNAAFDAPAINVDGSDRGFELFTIYYPDGTEVYLFLNRFGSRERLRQVIGGLERFVDGL